jgi:predicted DNA-binding transcriptional regulator YafY
MGTTRTHRLIRLLQLLQSGRRYDADRLAEDLRVSRRTLFRDLKMLDAAGVPYGYDKKSQAYAIAKEYFLPPVNLTMAEALAMMLVTRKLIHPRTHPAHRLALEATCKVENAIPPRIRRHCGSILDKVAARQWPVSDVDGVRSVLNTVQQAIHQQNKLSLRYDSYFDGKVIDVVLHPYRAAFVHRGWYVIGRSEQHDAVRTFKLERVERATILPERFATDGAFDLDDYYGNAWQMIRGDRRYHVVIRFSPKVAGNVEEVLWHKTQSTRRIADGAMLFEVDVDGLQEISWWILGYGDQAEVLEPQELRQLIADRARAMAAIYAESKPSRARKEAETQ